MTARENAQLCWCVCVCVCGAVDLSRVTHLQGLGPAAADPPQPRHPRVSAMPRQSALRACATLPTRQLEFSATLCD